MKRHPLLEEIAAQRRARNIITGPHRPIITDRRSEWRWQRACHDALGFTPKLKIWRA